ncbi:unnamed protein product [Darwinula stevensoni]|uniref:N-myc downstream regulated n=1 Tax=Darwinula stevensoni TaxID=69355 RepID=A0A7R8WYY9_9CRUS|nr:unnamed protein product [Darwinula stevensoni]CAG0879619.1 unnamed protein product [Darwinula stevensoni]
MAENGTTGKPAVEESKHTIPTERCGDVTVFVQGDLVNHDKKAVFLTIHDLGCNHTSFHDFVEHPAMSEIKQRSVFIHVDVPGQEDNAPDLPDGFVFPAMQDLGDAMSTVLDMLDVKFVVGLGEGAGANILARFGLAHPSRVLGLILIHPTSTVAGVMETIKDKIISWKLTNLGMNTTAEEYLIFHRFGTQLTEQMEVTDNKERVMREFQQKLKSSINPKNLSKYVNTFLNRTDISSILRKNLQVETMVVVGSKASNLRSVHTMHQSMDSARAQLLQLDGVGDVLSECPEKMAQSLLLFVKGLGLLTSVTMVGVQRQRTFSGGSEDEVAGRPRTQRSLSMEEYDRPNLQRLLSRERRESRDETVHE